MSQISFLKGARRTIAVVGGSFGGQNIIQNLLAMDNDLKGLQIVWADKLSHFENITANYEAFTGEREFEKNYAHFQEYVDFYDNSNLHFTQGRLTEVNSESNEIVLQQHDGSSQTIPYDSLVISTG